MKKNKLCALTLASMCLAASLNAQVTTVPLDNNQQAADKPAVQQKGGNGNGSGNTAPELDANSLGAGLVLLAGGALIVLGRRRKALV